MQQNSDCEEDMKLFKKASIELMKLQTLLKQQLLVRHQLNLQQKIEALTRIIGQIKRRLMAQPETTQQMNTFLDQINPHKMKHKRYQSDQPTLDSVVLKYNEQFQPHSEILQIAKKTVSQHQSSKILPIRTSLNQLYDQIDNEDDQLIRKHIQQEEIQLLRQVENQYANNTQSPLNLDAINQFEERLNSIMLEHQSERKQKIKEQKDLIHKTTQDLFRHKWGNSIVKRNLQRVEDMNKYQLKQKKIINDQMNLRLKNNNLATNKTQFTTTSTNSNRRETMQISLAETVSSPARSDRKRGTQRISFGFKIPIKKSFQLLPLHPTPPPIVDSFRSINYNISQAADTHYKTFKQDKNTFRNEINSFENEHQFQLQVLDLRTTKTKQFF